MSTQHLKDARQKVLVVDDDPSLRALLADFLERMGFDVRTAPDGQAGLNALAECHFDLIFSDFRMPGMTGLEMAAFVRRTDPAIPIILVTGEPTALGAKAVAQAGITRVLLKPFTTSELLELCSISWKNASTTPA